MMEGERTVISTLGLMAVVPATTEGLRGVRCERVAAPGGDRKPP